MVAPRSLHLPRWSHGFLPAFALVAFAWACSSSSPASGSNPDGGDDGAPSDDAGDDSTDDAPDVRLPDGGLPFACAVPPGIGAATYAVRFDQVGYLPEGKKWAVVLGAGGAAPQYTVQDANGSMVTSGVAGPRVLTTTSLAGTPLTGDRIDLPGTLGPGQYTVALADGTKFGPVVVDPNAYAQLLPLMLRFFGVQRCGPTTAAVSMHGACHLYASIAGGGTFSGDGIAVNDGYTGNVQASTGPAANVEGGWHDAGDYIKFLNTTAFVLAVDLLALRDDAAVFKGARLGNAYEALRTEMRWGLDWVTKMLGGAEMYHQVSGDNDHNVDWRIPEADTQTPVPGYDQRPVFRFAAGQGGNLLGRAAAALALGSQVYADDAAYSAQLLALAKKAYGAGTGLANPQSSDPVDFYTESTVDDDLSLAAAVLAQITADPTYLSDALAHARAIGSPGPGVNPLYWGDLSALAYLETAQAAAAGSADQMEMSADLAALAAPIVKLDATPSGPGAAFHYGVDSFGNGTIEQSLGAAAVCLASKRLGGASVCAEIARTQLHWMLGQNPFGESFMIGAGKYCPQNLHHAFGQAAQVTIQGAIAGGPTAMSVLTGLMDPGLPLPTPASPFAPVSTADLVYDDVTLDYVVNEPAIDFTGPLVYVLGELLGN